MSLEVIGAGFGRTGTLSLKVALEQLGYDPCYHMTEVIAARPGANDGHVEAWHAFVCEGRAMDWPALLAAYRACTDFPTCLFTRELMDAFPESRVVLTVRDPESWVESMLFLWETTKRVRAATADDPRMVRWYEFVDALLRQQLFGGRVDRESCLRAFERHTTRVVELVPPERLLVFDVREGWAPLCGFLGREAPDAPFPRLNERAVMERAVGAFDPTSASVAEVVKGLDPGERDS